MKRDMDAVKACLEAVESLDNGGINPQTIEVPGYDERTVGYHMALLVEAGFVEGVDATSFDSKAPVVMVRRLTWQGHEFLDTIRSKSAWAAVKTFAAAHGGTLSTEIMKSVAVKFLESQIKP